jgi:hypothetical protein
LDLRHQWWKKTTHDTIFGDQCPYIGDGFRMWGWTSSCTESSALGVPHFRPVNSGASRMSPGMNWAIDFATRDISYGCVWKQGVSQKYHSNGKVWWLTIKLGTMICPQNSIYFGHFPSSHV